MTSDRKRAANRANASRSTGPKTAAGKARSAGNARRHGLTARPDAALVRDWYRLILDDPNANPDPLERDPRRRAARDLAEAEARLSRVRLVEEMYFFDPQGVPSKWEKVWIEESKRIWDALDDRALERKFLNSAKNKSGLRSAQTPREYERWVKQGERFLMRFEKERQREVVRREKAQTSEGDLLARYRAMAEARRHKALHQWIKEITKRTQIQP